MTTEDFKYGKALGRRTVLANGMEVHTVCSDERVGMKLRIVVDVGQQSDGDMPGAAHLLEHLVLTHEAFGHRPWINAAAVEGCRVHGSTHGTFTEYSMAGPSAWAREGIRLLLNAIVRPVWSAEHVAKERQILLQEEANKLSGRRIQNACVRALYPILAPFATLEDLGECTVDRIQAHHAAFYGPSVVRVFYAGRGIHQDIVETVASVLTSDHPGRMTPRPAIPPFHPGRFTIRSTDSAQSSIAFLWPKRPLSSKSAIWPALLGWPFGLLIRRLRFQDGLIYDFRDRDLGFTPEKPHSIFIPVLAPRLEAVERAAEETFEEIRHQPLPVSVFAAVKASWEDEWEEDAGEESRRAGSSRVSAASMHSAADAQREPKTKTESALSDSRDLLDPERIREEAHRFLDPAIRATLIVSP